MEEEHGYKFVKIKELYEIASKVFDDLPLLENYDRGMALTLQDKLNRATGENYSLDPLDWGMGEIDDG